MTTLSGRKGDGDKGESRGPLFIYLFFEKLQPNDTYA